jgi:transcriptional regulator
VYIPHSFAEHDVAALHGFMDAHPLAAVVTHSLTDGVIATHLPFVLDRVAGPLGTLFGHFARANPHSRCVADGPVAALVMFTGPNAYISPTWYRTKEETGQVVPTWNYIAVHAHGMLRLHNDPSLLRAHLEMLTHRHESGRVSPWHLGDAPPDYIGGQMKAIVGVALQIDRLDGKWKMSQNRPDADIAGVIDGLAASPASGDHAVAAIVGERRPGK